MPKRKNRKAKVGSPFSFVGIDGERYRLTLKQRIFCEKFIEFRGNATKAAGVAGYSAKKNDVLRVIASRNLTNDNILAYIRLLLRDGGLSDEGVDRELLFVLRQGHDLHAKMRAIQEYNKIRGRLAPDKHEVKSKEERIVKIIDYSKVEID